MHSLAWWPTVLVLSVSTFTDLRSRRIPNWLVFPFLGLGILVSLGSKVWHGVNLGQSLEGMGLGLLIYGALAFMGGMGMGDVKLCAAIGAWVGPQQLFLATVVTALAGGMMAILWAVAGGFLFDLVKSSFRLVFGWNKKGDKGNSDLNLSNPLARKMPYAPAIAIGTLVSFFAH